MDNIKPYDRFTWGGFELSFVDYWKSDTNCGCFEIVSDNKTHGVDFEVLFQTDNRYKLYNPINNPSRYWIISFDDAFLKKIDITPNSKLLNIVDQIIKELE